MNHPVSLPEAQAQVDAWMREYLGDKAVPVTVTFVDTPQLETGWARTNTDPLAPKLEIMPAMAIMDRDRWLETLKHEVAHAIDNVHRFERVNRDLTMYWRSIQFDNMLSQLLGTWPGHGETWQETYRKMGNPKPSPVEYATADDLARLNAMPNLPLTAAVREALVESANIWKERHATPPL